MVAGETLQRSATHGYTETFNRALNFTLSSSPTFTGGITIQRDRPALTLTDTDTVLSSGESAAVIIVNTSDDDGGVGLAGAIEFLGAGTTGAVAIDLRTAAPGGVGTVASRLHADSTRVTIPGNLRVDGTLGLRANGGASSLILPKRTATLIGDATDSINTTDKVGGKMIIDTTNGRFLRCNGADGTAATATTPWLNLDGTTAITPA
jgi:hypothetical protein